MERIICPICGKSYLKLMSHLTWIHKITKAEFLELYPGYNLISEDIRLEMSKKWVGKDPWNKGKKIGKQSIEHKERRGIYNPHSDETKLKQSIAMIGNCNLPKGPKSEQFKQHLSEVKKGYHHTYETKQKLSMYAKNRSDATRLKLRVAVLNNIEANLKNGHQLTPFFNPKGCAYFDQLMLETNTHIQHAMNGGEFRIKELGYWVDGYDKENNIVYEYDETQHFNKDGTLCERDIRRQKEIEEFLNCKFIRIKHGKENQDYDDIIENIKRNVG